VKSREKAKICRSIARLHGSRNEGRGFPLEVLDGPQLGAGFNNAAASVSREGGPSLAPEEDAMTTFYRASREGTFMTASPLVTKLLEPITKCTNWTT
jgi:hypothetical protein